MNTELLNDLNYTEFLNSRGARVLAMICRNHHNKGVDVVYVNQRLSKRVWIGMHWERRKGWVGKYLTFEKFNKMKLVAQNKTS